MGLRDTFKSVARTAVAAFGDVRVSTNYWSHVSTTFDVSAGTPADVYGTTTGVMVIFDEQFRISEIDGQAVTPQDRRVLGSGDIPVLPPRAVLPPLPQQAQDIRRQHHVAVLAALGLDDADDVLGAVDIAGLSRTTSPARKPQP